MKYLPFLILAFLLGCTPVSNNNVDKNRVIDECGTKKITLDDLRNIGFDSNGAEILNDSLLVKKYNEFKKEFISFLDSNKMLVENSDIAYMNEKFLNVNNCIMSLGRFYAADSLTFIYGSPIYNYSPESSTSSIIDTVKIFVSVIVPLMDNEPFKVKNRVDIWSDFLKICYYNGQFGFFLNNRCIDTSQITNYFENQYSVYKGDRSVLRNNKTGQYFTFPTEEVVWSDDNSKLVFMEYGELKDTNDYPIPQISLFDLSNWEKSFLVYGQRLDFLGSNNSFIYFSTNRDNFRETNSINLYDFNSNVDKILLQIPDSLNCGYWSEDFFRPSSVELSEWESQSCYSMKLYTRVHSESPRFKNYIAYFSENGELFELK